MGGRAMDVPMTVLLVDSDETSALEIQRFLAGIGSTIVLLAESGRDLAAALVGGTVDLVIVTASEYDACAAVLAERPAHQSPPVLVISDQARCGASGESDGAAAPWLVRPMDEGVFRAVWAGLQAAR